ncbi:cytochrome c [Bradyrhizobium sp. Tv2a-2]|uniref:c-type cytochrome n=1 Tax=Bradyrhizobium sp. Tv2a-2 TaxID=113395 RepID=UPI00040668C0|nr:cytochrome c [Bradyrhizobium sp. Tv2a-2]
MHRSIIAFTCLAAALLFATPGWVQEKITLKSTSVDLPDPGALFPGPGADAVNSNCLACHSTEMVLTQPAFPKATWEAEVQKMIKVYKAPVDEKDVGAIVDYLVRTKGKS